MTGNIGLKSRTIKSVLRRRTDAWIKSLPEDMQKQVKEEAIVSGGCIVSMLLGEKFSDIDIYFRTKETTLRIAQHYVERFKKDRKERGEVPFDIFVQEMQDVRGEDRIRIVVKSAGVESETGDKDYQYFEGRPPEEAGDYVGEVFDDPETIADIDEEFREKTEETRKKEAESQNPEKMYRPVFLSSNAITLANNIQICIRFFGEPDKIHDNYDFIHCTNYWEASTGKLVLKPEALEAILTRSLVYKGSRYPVASLFRMRKFISRGWRINAGQIVKMAVQISDLNLHSYDVLEDQLTGVDVAYFAQVLSILEDQDKERIDSAYLIEVIDRMFGE